MVSPVNIFHNVPVSIELACDWIGIPPTVSNAKLRMRIRRVWNRVTMPVTRQSTFEIVASSVSTALGVTVWKASWAISLVVVSNVVSIESEWVDPRERVVNISCGGGRVRGDTERIGAGVGGGMRVVVAVMVVV